MQKTKADDNHEIAQKTITLRGKFANTKTRREILVARIYDFSAKIASLRFLNPRQKSQIRR